MINLLPPDTKKQLRAARSNTLLLRYNLLLLATVIFLIACCVFVYIFLISSKANAEATVKENDAKVVSFAKVEKNAAEYRSNLATAKQILDKEVDYTDSILAIANTIPSGVVLDSITLDSKSFGTPSTFTARAKSYDAALNLKDSFQRSSIFSNVYFSSIAKESSGSDENSSANEYPFTVTINATIAKDGAKK